MKYFNEIKLFKKDKLANSRNYLCPPRVAFSTENEVNMKRGRVEIGRRWTMDI